MVVQRSVPLTLSDTGGGAETAHWFLKMLPCKNEQAKLYTFLWLFLTMYGQPLKKQMWSQIFFVCPQGGSQIFFWTPEKKNGKKIASDPNFFLDKFINWYSVSCLKKILAQKKWKPRKYRRLKKISEKSEKFTSCLKVTIILSIFEFFVSICFYMVNNYLP